MMSERIYKRTIKQRKKISRATKKAMSRPEVQRKIRKLRGGKSSQKNYCIDCGKQIDYRSLKCKSCAYKNRKYTEEHNQKIRDSNLIRFKDKRNHPSWRGGLSFELYPIEFYKIRNKILERDNYTCQKCNKYGNAVHHIDYNKQHNNEENLITLCISCNLKVNKDREYWKEYFQKNLLHVQIEN